MAARVDVTYMAECMGPGMFGMRWFNPYRLAHVLQQEFEELDGDQRVTVEPDDAWTDFYVRGPGGGFDRYRLHHTHPGRDEGFDIIMDIRFEHVRKHPAPNDRIDLTLRLTKELAFTRAQSSVQWCGHVIGNPLALTFETLDPRPPDRFFCDTTGSTSAALSLSASLFRQFVTGNSCDRGGMRFPRLVRALPEAFAVCWEEPLRS